MSGHHGEDECARKSSVCLVCLLAAVEEVEQVGWRGNAAGVHTHLRLDEVVIYSRIGGSIVIGSAL